MAIRQYIGARYVLKIYENSLDPQSADWEAGVAYEPLVMVNYNNSSYISRKQVPANIGDPVSNPTYWALSGLYNGQIASLQNQINTIDNTVNGLVARPSNRKMIVISDSFGYGIRGGGQPWVTGWVDYLKNLMGDDLICYDRANDPFTGTAAFLGGPNAWNDLFTWILENKMGDVSPTEITDVVVLGGNNEPDNSEAALITHLTQVFFPNVKTHCPNARIAIGCIGLDANLLYRKAYEGYRKAAIQSGVEFISDTLNLGCIPAYDSGYGHWSEAGYNFYNPYVAHAVLYGHVDFCWRLVYSLTMQSDVTISGTLSFRAMFVISNKSRLSRLSITSLTYAGWTLINNTADNTGSVPLTAFKFTDPIYFYLINGDPVCYCEMIDNSNGANIGEAISQYILDNGDWYIKFNGFRERPLTGNLASNIAYSFDGSTYVTLPEIVEYP